MNSKNGHTLRNTVLGGFFVALGVLLPIMFHSVGLGKVFLPMHIPVFFSGFLCGPFLGFVVGCTTPPLSSVLTGMPPFMPPMAQTMAVELAVYGMTAGYLYRRLRLGTYLSLVCSMVCGRLVYGVLGYYVLPLFGFPKVALWAPLTTSLVQSLPGVVLQLFVVPVALVLAERNAGGLVAFRRPEEVQRPD